MEAATIASIAVEEVLCTTTATIVQADIEATAVPIQAVRPNQRLLSIYSRLHKQTKLNSLLLR
jgi:hypothetical protein